MKESHKPKFKPGDLIRHREWVFFKKNDCSNYQLYRLVLGCKEHQYVYITYEAGTAWSADMRWMEEKFEVVNGKT